MAKDFAPAAILRAGREADKEIPGCTLSGVLGDAAHVRGYHRGRCVLPRTDYSVKLTLDKQGEACAASALDLSFTAVQMKVVTKRLRDSALDPDDPRMKAVREFYGTLDGRTVFGLSRTAPNKGWGKSSSDKSHLWHIHTSFFRAFSNSYKDIRAVVDVMKGIPWKKPTAPEKPTPPPTVPAQPVPAPKPPAAPKKTVLPAWSKGPNDYFAPYLNTVPPIYTSIRLVQQRLKELGYMVGAIDGQFGPTLRKAVVKFQKDNRLTTDGLIGPNTWNTIRSK